MMADGITRRHFLETTAAGVSAIALGAPGVARGYPANEKVQVGWIGIGHRGSGLLRDFVANVEDARTAAVCDLIPEKVDKAKEMAAKDSPNGYTDMRKMMESEKLDGILVATAPCDHAEVVVPVLDAGFHCFAEKPMDTTVAKVDALTIAARKAWKEKGKFYQIGTQRRFHPGYKTCIKAIHDGMIGEITFMQGEWHWPGMVNRIPVERDGGRLNEQAVHHTDVACWVMKDHHPLRCCAMALAQGHKPEGPNVLSETHSTTAWEFPGGVVFSYTHLFYLPRHFTEEKFWVFGTKGGIDLVHGMFYKFQAPDVPASETDQGTRIAIDSGENWNLGTVEELKGFVDRIKDGAKELPPANVETGRRATLMALMGRTAAVNEEKNCFEPSVVAWEDLGSKTEEGAIA